MRVIPHFGRLGPFFAGLAELAELAESKLPTERGGASTSLPTKRFESHAPVPWKVGHERCTCVVWNVAYQVRWDAA